MEEILDYWGPNAGPMMWRLTPAEVRKVLCLRYGDTKDAPHHPLNSALKGPLSLPILKHASTIETDELLLCSRSSGCHASCMCCFLGGMVLSFMPIISCYRNDFKMDEIDRIKL